jgi:hypothetical protein
VSIAVVIVCDAEGCLNTAPAAALDEGRASHYQLSEYRVRMAATVGWQRVHRHRDSGRRRDLCPTHNMRRKA